LRDFKVDSVSSVIDNIFSAKPNDSKIIIMVFKDFAVIENRIIV